MSGRSVKGLLLASVLLLTVSVSLGKPVRAATGPVLVLDIKGVINPFTTQYLARGLNLAEQRDAALLIVMLDTPGGLESAMRDMVQLLLDSPVPTAVYVTPGGARATSAGMFILVAADVAAMAPTTHVGAAHPVPLGAEIDEIMSAKAASDAAALVRGVAATRGRNADWVERAVRENLSVTEVEALELGVIDYIASDLNDLLRQLEGQEVGERRLQLVGRATETAPMNWSESFYHIITDPNIAYLLLSLGTLLLLTEVADPGLSVAGIGSAVAFILAFLGMGNLPVNWAAIALLAVSVVLFVVGLLTDTEAVVTAAALVPFILGSLLLFSPFSPTSPAMPDVRVSFWLIAVMAVGMVAFSYLVLRAIIAASHIPPRAGAQRLVGLTGAAITDLTPAGQVRVDLQDWSAISVGGEIRAGAPVRVTGVSGVRLEVVPAGAAVPNTA